MTKKLAERVYRIDLENPKITNKGANQHRSSLSNVKSIILLTSSRGYTITCFMIIQYLDARAQLVPVISLPDIKESIVAIEDPEINIIPYS